MKSNYLLSIIAYFFLLNLNAQDVSFTTQSVSGGNGNIGAIDLNGDFLDDLLAPSQSNLLIQYQTETGFDLTNIPVSASNPPSWSVSVADFDANGINDIMYGGDLQVIIMDQYGLIMTMMGIWTYISQNVL